MNLISSNVMMMTITTLMMTIKNKSTLD